MTLILKMVTALYGEATKDLQCIMWLNPKSLKHILGTGVKNLRTRIFYVFLISLHSAHFIHFILVYLVIGLSFSQII